MSTVSAWTLFPKPNPEAKLRLFCFSHAGAGASMFRSWGALAHAIAPDIEICAVQRPGRENRWEEKPYRETLALVDPMADALLPYLDKPFICFGHSVGALLCFEWVRCLRKQNASLPRHLFVSGRQAPHIPASLPWQHVACANDLITQVRNYGGTPESVLESRDFTELYLPILRADLAMHETYVYSSEKPLSMPISALGGLQDKQVSRGALEAWKQQTTGSFQLRMLEGGHLFVNDSAEAILQTIAQDIALPIAV